MNFEAINKVLQVAKRMDEKNLMSTFDGNISLKENGFIYITPSGKNKAFLTPEMIAVLDEQGNQVSGIYKASSELPMHTNVYKMRKGIGGILHAHATFLTAFAMCHKPVKTCANAGFMEDFNQIEVVPYGPPGSHDIYAGVKPILDKGSDVMILANHGALAVGSDVFDAMNKLEAVENAAKILTILKLVGDPCDLSDDEIKALLGC